MQGVKFVILIFALPIFFCISIFDDSTSQKGHYNYASRPLPQTRSLSGTYVTDGNNATNDMVLLLIKVGLLGGYAIRKVKMYNDRIYLDRYRRSYWLGSRYYYLDNYYYLAERDTCAYRMNESQRAGLEYTDNVPIVDVIYQCQRYAQHCCGLDCCANTGRAWQDPALEYVSNGMPNTFQKRTFWFALILCVLLPFVWCE